MMVRKDNHGINGSDLQALLVFLLDGATFALPLPAVEQVVRAVEIANLPGAPAVVLGLINFRGRLLPVAGMRKRFGLTEREPQLDDQLVIANTSRRRLALLIDAVDRVIDVPYSSTVKVERILTGVDYVKGVVKLDGGLVLIHDLEALLSLEEERTLTNALAAK